MQSISRCFRSFLHGRKLLRLQIMNGGLRNASTNRLCRSLVFLAGLFVGRGVEREEQYQIRAQSGTSGESSEFFTSTSTDMWKLWKVCAGGIIVGGIVDKSWILYQQNSQIQECEQPVNLPRSMMNWAIWSLVIHSFHQIRIPLAAWK